MISLMDVEAMRDALRTKSLRERKRSLWNVQKLIPQPDTNGEPTQVSQGFAGAFHLPDWQFIQEAVVGGIFKHHLAAHDTERKFPMDRRGVGVRAESGDDTKQCDWEKVPAIDQSLEVI